MPRKLTHTPRTTPIIIEDIRETQREGSLDLNRPQISRFNIESYLPDVQALNMKSDTASQCDSSIDKSLSYCSKYSRINIDMKVYKSIYNNRDKHNVFTSIDEDPDRDQWYYICQSNEVKGPFDAHEMDHKFNTHILMDNTKVKRERDEKYHLLTGVVRRYYRNVLACPKAQTQRTSNLSSRTIRFRKTTITSIKKCEPESLEINGRDERVGSGLPKPSFAFLNNVVNDSSDDEDESCISRARSQTMAM